MQTKNKWPLHMSPCIRSSRLDRLSSPLVLMEGHIGGNNSSRVTSTHATIEVEKTPGHWLGSAPLSFCLYQI